MKFNIALLISLLSLLAQGQEIIRNIKFEQVASAKFPANWVYRGEKPDESSASDGILTLTDGMTIQHGVKLKPETIYVFSYQVKGAENSQSRVYFEWNKMKDGKRVGGGRSASTEFTGNQAAWADKSFQFQYPADMSSPYIVLQSKGQSGFRNLQVKELSALETFGKKWQLSPASKIESETLVAAGSERNFLKGIRIEPNSRYELSFDATGRGDANSQTGYFRYGVEFHFSGKADYLRRMDDLLPGTTQRKKQIFQTPADAKTEELELRIFMSGKGEIMFGNFALTKLEEDLSAKYPILLKEPSFRNNIYASMPVKKIHGSIPVDEKIKDYEITFSGPQKVTALRKADTLEFAIDAPDLAPGRYTLTATLKTGSDTLTREVVIEKFPAAAQEVIQGPDRFFYINGKKVLPVLQYHGGRNDMMEYAASRGINILMVHVPRPTEEKVLDTLNAAEKAGIRIMLHLDLPDRNVTAENFVTSRWEEVITGKVTSHPGLFGYYLADEPAWAGYPLGKLAFLYDTLKRLDPFHPVWICEAPRGTLEELMPYARCADILGADIYPFPYPSQHSGIENKSPSCTGEYTRRMLQAGNDRKAVLMVLQAFSWKQYQRKFADAPEFPPLSGLRFTIYDAIVNGATLLGFWGQHYIYTPEFYDTFFTATDEIHNISGLLASAAPRLTAEKNGIRCYTWQYKDHQYLLAMNYSNENVETELSFPEQYTGLLTVFQETRSISTAAGKFTDSFTPFSVHFYGNNPLPEPLYRKPPVPQENPYHQAAVSRATAKK